MLKTKFQEHEPKCSEEEDIEYFSMYFYGSNPGPPSVGLVKTGVLHLNNLGEGH